MADVVNNYAKGRAVQWFQNVEDNSPANAEIVYAVCTGGVDNDYADATDLSNLLAGTPAEVTNTNYTRKSHDETNITITVDTGNDRVDVDVDDITWTAIAAGDAWTKLVVCYDPDNAAGTDANIEVISAHDFSVTPDGSDITAQINANGIFRAS